jgi:hypothetical protein
MKSMIAAVASLFLAVTLLGSPAVQAGEPKRFDIKQTHTDDEGPRHWIVFMARPADPGTLSPGHAFVQFGREDEKAQMTRFEAWGFYPEGGSKGSFGQVPGNIVDDVKSGSLAARTVLVSVEVTDVDYDAAKFALERWQKEAPAYHLFTAQNCIDFAHAIAKELGLATPNRSKLQFPVEYVEQLGELNR